jgi:uncharacterized protein
LSIYLDTSVVMSFFIRDDHAGPVRAWAETNPDVTISDWTATEFTSALSHYIRRETLAGNERDAIERAFDRWAARRTVLEVERERFAEARTLMRSHRRLRAPDALHLAIARHFDLTLATMDQDMRDAALAEGLEVVEL